MFPMRIFRYRIPAVPTTKKEESNVIVRNRFERRHSGAGVCCRRHYQVVQEQRETFLAHVEAKTGTGSPNAGLRAAIVPGPPQKPGDDADHHEHGAPARMGWARLLRRVFDIDLEHCPQCGGDLKIIAAIEEPTVIVRILTHLGLPARAPPRSPARPLDLFQAA
jgi:hypothetical protein